MVVLQSMTRAGSWTQFRSFSKSFAQLERFTRESLRNRIHKQNLKDYWKVYEQNLMKNLEVFRQNLKEFLKQYVHHPGPSKPPLPVDVNLLRPLRDLWKALRFTVAVGVGSLTITYFWSYNQLFSAGMKKDIVVAENAYACSEDCLVTVQKVDRQKITWETLTSRDKATVYFFGANALVYLMWKVKPLNPFLLRYFCSSFLASRSLCLPMLLRVFSHTSLVHFGCNMFLFYTFANLTIDKFAGPGQFWAFFCTAAVVSSLMSLVIKAAFRSPMHALGARGAVLALLVYALTKDPNARLKSDSFLVFDISLMEALIGLILFDLVCLALFRKNFRLFDYPGQLGGILFGVFYALYGEQIANHLFVGDVDVRNNPPMVDLYMCLNKYRPR